MFKEKMRANKKEPLFKINLQLFTEGGDGNTGQDGGEGNSNDGGNTKSFTQTELDNIVKGRVADTKKAAEKALLDSLGLEKMDDLKTIVAAKKKADDDKKTDLEKLQEEINTLKGEKETATKKAKETLVIADFKLKAIGQGLDEKQIEAALKLTDLSSLEVKEDGAVEGTEEAIKATIEAYPFLKGSTGSNVGGGAGGNPGGDDGKGGNLTLGQRLARDKKERAEKSSKKQNHYFK